MKPFTSVTAALLLLVSVKNFAAADDSPKTATPAKPNSAVSPPQAEPSASPARTASPAPSLRKPGFVFMELGTTRVEEYFTFFESVAGFRLVERRPGYLVVQSDRAELTFIDPKYWAHGHPFSGKLNGTDQGVGIEIGIVVADIDKAYAEAVKFKEKGFPISTGIVRRPWGSRDFRVLATEGYYFRFTEGR